MANSDKNIKITPNTNEGTLPVIQFTGFNNAPLYLRVLDANDLQFQSTSSYPLLSITQSTTGKVFSIVEQSGLPLFSVDTSKGVYLSPFLGNVSIGQTNSQWKLDILGPSTVTNFLNGSGSDKMAVMIRAGGGVSGGRLSGIDFNSYHNAAGNPGSEYPHVRIACRSDNSGSFLLVGTSDNYSTGITNRAITINPEGYVAITHDNTNHLTFNDPDSAVCINTSGNTAATRTVVLKNYNQSLIPMGSYPSTWSPALMIQNPSNNGWLWLCALETGYNARIVTGGKGLDFFVNAPASSSGSGNQLLSLNTDGLNGAGGNGHAFLYGPLRQRAVYDFGRHYSIYSYNSTASGAYYIHMKTNIPWFNSYVMFWIQAKGYAYGNTQMIDCRWTGYTYFTSGLIQTSYNNVTSGMSANTMYQSSDGYLVLVGYSTGHYYIGFTLDAGFHNPTPGGFDLRITGGTYSSSQTGVY